MRDHRVAIGLVCSLCVIGCGRFGFSDQDGANAALGDDLPSPPQQLPPPCMETSLRVSPQSTSSVQEPRLAWNGTKLGVAWIEQTMPLQVQFRTVSLDGTLDPVASPGPLALGEAIDLAWDGASWRLAWADDDPNRELMASADGGAPIALTASSRQDMRARVAPMSGGQIGYLWVSDQPSRSLRLTVVDAAGAKLVSDLVVATPNDLETHSLVWTGTELAVIYGASTGLMLQRLTPAGTPVTAPVMLGSVAGELPYVAAAWSGDRFLVAWNSADGIRIAYFGADGSLLHPAVGAASSGPLLTYEAAVAVGPVTDAVLLGGFMQEMNHDGTIGELHPDLELGPASAVWIGKRWAFAAIERVTPTPAHPDPEPDFVSIVQMCSAAAPAAM